ncbi:hypothetical protein ACE7GA_18740 [Roseomonas sp. CCTCC AB2023176]|uniref:hypothetical protein n=1 Tax=Roseomonas sp. CCTCC AB2023176 TaxID=3342640 RepID=UPI0035E1C203
MSIDWCVVLGVLCAVAARSVWRGAHPLSLAFVAAVGSLGALIGDYLGVTASGGTGWIILPWTAAGAVLLPVLFYLSALRDDAEDAALQRLQAAPPRPSS